MKIKVMKKLLYNSNSMIVTVELHSMLLTISPFMFWEDSKTFTESILSLLVFLARNGTSGLLMQYLRTLANNILKP